MKTFRFPLERALQWRRTQLELENIATQRLAQRRAELEGAVQALDAQRAQAELSVARASTLEAFELLTMSSFQSRVARARADLSAKHAELQRETAAQVAKTMESQRRVRLLERLRERRFTEWTKEMEAEQERFAAEAWLGRWPMLKQADEKCAITVDTKPAMDQKRSQA